MGASKKEVEFPLLAAQGLYVANTTGNGNCLFNALSDQIHGNESLHSILRSRVIEYMREHDSYYKQFVEVHPGGGTRRNPKRKTAALDSNTRTAEDINKGFQNYLNEMGKKGTYGDNLEISAFARAYKIDVRVHRKEGSNNVLGGPVGVERPLAHIAYHDYEHYSSVRSFTGPSKGLPNITPPITLSPALLTDLPSRPRKIPSPSPRQEPIKPSFDPPPIEPWIVDNNGHAHMNPLLTPSPSPTPNPPPPSDPHLVELIMNSLPYLADRATIHKTLSKYNNDVNSAVSCLLDLEEAGDLPPCDLDGDVASQSSTPGSSSIERDVDTEDDDVRGPRKKLDRRMSRATKAALLAKKEEEEEEDREEGGVLLRPRVGISPARKLGSQRRRKKEERRKVVGEVGKENSPSVPDLHVLSI